MKRFAVLSGLLIAAIIVTFWVIAIRVAKAPEQVFCAQDVRECPDGSFVSRVPPACEFAACSAEGTSGGGGIAPFSSGARGTVSLGPTCPVVQDPPDPGCADKPYQTTVSAYRAGASALFSEAKTDERGSFELSLPPGAYVLTAGSKARWPRCADATVEVGPSGYVEANISCDTGIR